MIDIFARIPSFMSYIILLMYSIQQLPRKMLVFVIHCLKTLVPLIIEYAFAGDCRVYFHHLYFITPTFLKFPFSCYEP